MIDIFVNALLIQRVGDYVGALSYGALGMRHFFFSLNEGTRLYRLGSHRKLRQRDWFGCIDALSRHHALLIFHRIDYELLQSLSSTMCVIHEETSVLPTPPLQKTGDGVLLLTGFAAV